MSAPDPRMQMALDRVRDANATVEVVMRNFRLPREQIVAHLAHARMDLSVAAGQLAAVVDDLPLNSPLTKGGGR